MKSQAALYAITLLLSGFSTVSTFCRFAAIDMKGVQYRYVAPFVLIFVSSLALGLSILGGDRIVWYQPVTMLTFCLYLWNTKLDWRGGMPRHYYRFVPDRRAPPKTKERVQIENLLVGAAVGLAIAVAGASSAAGRGNPITIFSMRAEPVAAFPGEPINILVTWRRDRVCAGFVNRFIVSQQTGAVVQRISTEPIGGVTAARKFVDYPVRIVPSLDLPAGRYAYRAVIYSTCDDDTYTQVTPDVPFVLSARPPAP